MKRNNIKNYFIACAALVSFLTGCDNADYKILDNAIYFSEAESGSFEKITADPENVTTTSQYSFGRSIGRRCRSNFGN